MRPLRPLIPLLRRPFSTAPRLLARKSQNLPPHLPEGGIAPSSVFSDMDMLSKSPTPASAIEELYSDGFRFASGMRRRGMKGGVILLNNEIFAWEPKMRPGMGKESGLFGVREEDWGILKVVWPKPDLLLVGTGNKLLLMDKKDREVIEGFGIRIECVDSGNAASAFSLLATERPGQVAAAICTLGFK